MQISMYTMSVEAFIPSLRALSKLLDKGAQHATARKFDAAVLANGRLAPDMFPLVKQVQIACDFAKNSIVTIRSCLGWHYGCAVTVTVLAFYRVGVHPRSHTSAPDPRV